MNRPFRFSLLAALALSTIAGGASAAIRWPTLPSLPSLPKLGDDKLVSCVSTVPDSNGAQASGVFGTDGSTNRNLRSTYLAAPVKPTMTAAGQRAKTPVFALSKNRPDGVMLGAAYAYTPAANGQLSMQLEHLVVRAPFVTTGGEMPRGDNAAAGEVRVALGDLVYGGAGKIADGGLEFYIAAKHEPGVGYTEIRPEDQLAFARAVAAQTPFEITVSDPATRQELYRATAALPAGSRQVSLMNFALTLASTNFAKGHNNKQCNP